MINIGFPLPENTTNKIVSPFKHSRSRFGTLKVPTRTSSQYVLHTYLELGVFAGEIFPLGVAFFFLPLADDFLEALFFLELLFLGLP